MQCIFIFKEKKDGVDLFECKKCGYIAKSESTSRECVPMPQSQYGEPSIFKKIGHFTFALAQHLYKGMPTVKEEVLKERLDICLNCELFKKKPGIVGGTCTHESCGCTIQDEIVFLNKIAWSDQECPLKKWLKIDQNGQKSV